MAAGARFHFARREQHVIETEYRQATNRHPWGSEIALQLQQEVNIESELLLLLLLLSNFLRSCCLEASHMKVYSIAFLAKADIAGLSREKAAIARAYSLDRLVPKTPLSSVHRTTGCPAASIQ